MNQLTFLPRASINFETASLPPSVCSPVLVVTGPNRGNDCPGKELHVFLSNFKGQQHFNTILNTHPMFFYGACTSGF